MAKYTHLVGTDGKQYPILEVNEFRVVRGKNCGIPGEEETLLTVLMSVPVKEQPKAPPEATHFDPAKYYHYNVKFVPGQKVQIKLAYYPVYEIGIVKARHEAAACPVMVDWPSGIRVHRDDELQLA